MRLLRLLRREDGIALVMSLGAIAALGIMSASIAYYTTANGSAAARSQSDEKSFSLAEAGVQNAVAILGNRTSDPTDPTLLPPTTVNYGEGSVTFSGTYDKPTAKWTVTSEATTTNPTGPGAGAVKRKLSAKIPIVPLNSQELAYDSWNYVYSWGTGDPSGCDMTLHSDTEVDSRLMAAGNLCLASKSKVTGGDVLVGGRINLYTNDNVIGSSAKPVNRVDSAGGCKTSNGVLHNPCRGPSDYSDRVWANTITSSPALEPAPTPDLNGWYLKASPGPYSPCESPTGTPPTFDNDQGTVPDASRRNRSVPGTFNLTPTSSYTCRTSLGAHTLGELSWNNTSKVLTLKGTIFIDGNAHITQSASYTGQATLYLSGSFRFQGGPEVCAVVSSTPPKCNYNPGAWDPNTRMFTIVANGDGGQNGVNTGYSMVLSGTGNWQGALYGGPYKINIENNFQVGGPIIADEVVLTGSVKSQPFSVITNAPTGMPGNETVNMQPDRPEHFSG